MFDIPSKAKSGIKKPQPHFPPPWILHGYGIILVYRFRCDWIARYGLLSPGEQSNFVGGLGFVMLVNYLDSPVGPYRELLIIPGKFAPHRRQMISKIYVDSEASTENGRYNWGIPKETVPFHWTSATNRDQIVIGSESSPILSCEIRAGGLSFPVTTRFLPIRLQQELDGETFRSNPSGSGWAKLARVENLSVDALRFPDITKQKPLACMRVSPFELKFPAT